MVNPSPTPIEARIHLDGVKSVASKARLISMTGEKDAENTFEHPEVVQPVSSEVDVASEFSHTIPAMAVEVLRVSIEQ